ncbi:hypothetical protein MCM45_14265 [Providencia rettgeri]|uniref:hypothetical protein n=1 Tax=Providencia rettgeri TaxID=587 RepID=UPI001EFE3EE3|nr:hypothetical protein [Providencia rettgeri]MCG9527710.1 hypothetical protein [Providencia rettgeri]
MKKIKISRWYISGFWAPLDGGPNEDEALLKLNLNNHSSIDLIVDKILKPYIDMLPLKYQIRFKDSFKYAIAYYSEKELKDFYYTGAPQLDLPDGITARDFYIYVWNLMYKNESYLASEKDNYTELSLNEIYKK